MGIVRRSLMKLTKPGKLSPGDKVATVSLSWGGAGDSDILWRYQAGKEYLKTAFGLDVVEMPNTLKGSEYLYAHPEKRAADLMAAFADKSVKGIFSCIGGEESVRLLPYIDFDIIANNPKIFIGYSDTTVTHMICQKAGLSSFYGPSILGEFGENGGLFAYTDNWVRKALFMTEPLGRVEPPDGWTSERLPWLETNREKRRVLQQNTGYELLQGQGRATGRLIGGCIEVLEMLKGTELWPESDVWKDSILFLETSEEKPEPTYIKYWLRNYATQGILQECNGILFGKPYDMRFYDEYKEELWNVIRDELGLHDLPILCNVSFGHTSPMCVVPYGAMAEIDCDACEFRILESGVI